VTAMTTTTPLSMHSRLALRWSTEPCDVGYPDRAGAPARDFRTGPVSLYGTPRQVVAEISAVRRRLGPGDFVAFYVTSSDGARVPLVELHWLVTEADCAADARRER